MLSDITLGQYFPGRSILHRMDPRAKMVLVLVAIVLIFTAFNFLSMGLVVALILAAMLLSGVTSVSSTCSPVISSAFNPGNSPSII